MRKQYKFALFQWAVTLDASLQQNTRADNIK